MVAMSSVYSTTVNSNESNHVGVLPLSQWAEGSGQGVYLGGRYIRRHSVVSEVRNYMARIELDAREARMYERCLSKRHPVEIQGTCAGCGAGIPHSYLPVVTKWGTDTDKPICCRARPTVMWCHKCAKGVRVERPQRLRHQYVTMYKADEMKAADIAIKVFGHLSRTPRSARRVSEKSGIEYAPKIKMVLQALAKAGKIVEEDGRFRKKTYEEMENT